MAQTKHSRLWHRPRLSHGTDQALQALAQTTLLTKAIGERIEDVSHGTDQALQALAQTTLLINDNAYPQASANRYSLANATNDEVCVSAQGWSNYQMLESDLIHRAPEGPLLRVAVLGVRPPTPVMRKATEPSVEAFSLLVEPAW
jgi:hypothetical protein